jgi:hypothetical protein
MELIAFGIIGVVWALTVVVITRIFRLGRQHLD